MADVGGGLVANYYADANFQNLALARNDAAVDFDWGAAAPAAHLPAEGFSVRWTGQVAAPAAGAYTLSADSAGGIRVTVGGQTVIDDWLPHARRQASGSFTFAAGTYYDLKVEYRDVADADPDAAARLLWTSSQQPTQVVPQAQLYRLGTGWVSGWSSTGLGGVDGSFAGSNDDFVLSTGAPGQPPPVPPPAPPPPPPTAPTFGATGFMLVNADANNDIGPLSPGQTVKLSSPNVNVHVLTTGTIGSVQFLIDGQQTRVEGAAPYAFGGDAGADYLPWNAPLGTHTLRAVAYSGPNLTGAVGAAAEVQVTFVSGTASPPPAPPATPPPPPASTTGVTSLTLVDAGTDRDVGPLNSGATVNKAGGGFSVRANVAGTTGSVVFLVDNVRVRAETYAPYSIAGDFPGDYVAWNAPLGTHTITAVPYSGPNGGGTPGPSRSATVNVVSESGQPVMRAASTSASASAATALIEPLAVGGGMAALATTPDGTGDVGQFAYKVFRGDGEIVGRLDSLTAGADADLLFRGTLAGGSPLVGLSVSGSTARLEWRTAADAALQAGPATSIAAGPIWLRLKRDGDMYAGYVSPTGTDGSWKLVGTTAVVLPGVFTHAGLAVGGPAVGEPAAAHRAAFTDVRVFSAPQLGGNLQRISDSSYDRPFVDLVKMNSGFKRLDGSSAPVNAGGWPTVSDFQVQVAGGGNIPAGRYTLAFTGPSGVRVTSLRAGVNVFRSSYNATTRQHVWYADVPAGQPTLGFRFQYTSTGLQNLRVLQPGYGPVNTPVYTAKYVNLLKSMNPASLRFMDWVGTNPVTIGEWGQRPTPNSADWNRKGVAWEACIDLANQLGTNLYVNVPARATDDYVRRLADLVRTRLRPDLNVYLELGNEQWIYAPNFPNGVWNYHEALKEVQAAARAGRQSDLNYDNRPVDLNQTTIDPLAPDTYAWNLRRTTRRAAQVADIFRQSWAAGGQADPVNTRVRVIMAAQVNVAASYRIMAEYADRFGGGASRTFWANGGAVYTRMTPYQDEQVNGRWQTLNPNLTFDETLAAMIQGCDRYIEFRRFENGRKDANALGLRLGLYEGGQDTFGPFNIAAKKQAVLDPRFGQAMERFLGTFFAQGGSTVHFYALGSQSYDTSNGTWAVSNNPGNWNTPRAQAFRNVRAGLLPNAFPSTGVYG